MTDVDDVVKKVHITIIILITRCLMESTDQADPISLLLTLFLFFCPLHFVQDLRSKNVKKAIITLLSIRNLNF